MNFDEYQDRAYATRVGHAEDDLLALGLQGEGGAVAAALRRMRKAKDDAGAYREDLIEQLGDALWYLSAIAKHHDISLDEVASAGLVRAERLYGARQQPWFDNAYPAEQQFPRVLNIAFRVNDEEKRVYMEYEGKRLGDSLNDSSPVEDEYRYHDVIHLAFAAKLHWSPVLRHLLRRKRTSDPQVDDGEDGARPRIVEEAISAILFSEARRYNWYKKETDIPLRTLDVIKQITRNYEVSVRTVPEWQEAICLGFGAFAKIKGSRHAEVTADLNGGSVEVKVLEPGH